jgi:opacity protein-like surface antigen
MRKTSLLAGATLLLAGPAVAADLARPVYKAPVAVAPWFTWTGCYVGAAVGGARGRQSAGTTTSGDPNALTPQDVEVTPAPTPDPQADTAGNLSHGTSVIGGPYVGCNYQFIEVAPAFGTG